METPKLDKLLSFDRIRCTAIDGDVEVSGEPPVQQFRDELAALKSENERLREALKCVVERCRGEKTGGTIFSQDGAIDFTRPQLFKKEITAWRALLSKAEGGGD